MTESEKQVIIDAVLTAIRTNSRTIEQLTAVSSLSSTDYFEVSGGRRIAYNVLASLIASMSADDQSNLQTAIDKKELQSVAITTTASEATLTIKSVGKTISCKIPIATSSQSGIITAADKVKLDSAYTTADSASRLASTAQETATQAKTAAGNAQSTADSATATAESALPKVIDINSLDSMGAPDLLRMMNLVRQASRHTRYAVINNGYIVGTLDVISDNSCHVITQILETHHSFENGVLKDNSHWDNKIFRYYRSYNVSASNLDAERGTWTKWTEVMPEGAAPLDAKGKVPYSNLPSGLNQLAEFSSFVSGITPSETESAKSSTSAGCIVVYDEDNKRFLLAVGNPFIIGSIDSVEESDWTIIRRPISDLTNKILPLAEVAPAVSASISKSDYWQIENGEAIINKSMFGYYTKWKDMEMFGDIVDGNCVPVNGRIYRNLSNNCLYAWDDDVLNMTGSNLKLGHTASEAFPGNEGVELEQRVSFAEEDISLHRNRIGGMAILPFDGFYDDNPDQSTGVWFKKNDSNHGGNSYMWSNEWPEGYTANDYNTSFHGFGIIRDDVIYRCGNKLYRYDGKNLVELGGSAVGNCFNITIERITTNKKNGAGVDASFYDDFESAVEFLIESGKAALGMQITYAQALKSWKTWQYLGGTTEPEELRDKDNWLDMAGLSAGGEAVVNVNYLCDNPTGEYNLSLAIKALLDKEEETKVNYRKPGLVLIYRSGQGKWESKMFLGTSVNDIKANTPKTATFGAISAAARQTWLQKMNRQRAALTLFPPGARTSISL